MELNDKENMEALVLALIALRTLNRQQETLHAEAEEFQPFDLQKLRHLYNVEDKSPSRLYDRQASYVAQAAS
jgi:hypothetical protein